MYEAVSWYYMSAGCFYIQKMGAYKDLINGKHLYMGTIIAVKLGKDRLNPYTWYRCAIILSALYVVRWIQLYLHG